MFFSLKEFREWRRGKGKKERAWALWIKSVKKNKRKNKVLFGWVVPIEADRVS